MFDKFKEKYFTKKSYVETKKYISISELPIYIDHIEIQQTKPIFGLERISNGIMKIRENIYSILLMETPRNFENIDMKDKKLDRGLITLAGFGGVILSYRKNFIRKSFNGLAAATFMSYLCFPDQVSSLTRKEYKQLSYYMSHKWNEFVKPPKPH
ncbi:unnamed protein product [Gordionus sp. m RMFG-2023]